MKTTTLLLWITYISLALSIIAFGIFGFTFLKNGFFSKEVEKGSIEGVVSKNSTGTLKLPMKMDVEYYLRIKDGKVLVDGYFFKIQKKFIPKAFLPKATIQETDYPKAMEGNIYSMPESDSYIYISTSYPSIEAVLSIVKYYFLLAFSLVLIAIILSIKFLQNCNKGKFFIPQNSTYLRVISYLAVGYSLIDYGAQWLIFREMNSKLEDSFSFSLNSDLHFNWKYLIFSLFLVIFAQAFTEGTKLKEEQSLTI